MLLQTGIICQNSLTSLRQYSSQRHPGTVKSFGVSRHKGLGQQCIWYAQVASTGIKRVVGQNLTNPRLFWWQNACCHTWTQRWTPLMATTRTRTRDAVKTRVRLALLKNWSRCGGGTCVAREPRRHPVVPHLPTGAVTLSHINLSSRHDGASQRGSSRTRLSQCKSIWIRLTRH